MNAAEKILNHGIIEEMTLPDGFESSTNSTDSTASADAAKLPRLPKLPYGYLEFQAPDCLALICYEETDESFRPDDIEKMETLLKEDLGGAAFRELNFRGLPGKDRDDSPIFDVLCFCFVFGGALTRKGAMMDIDRCTWEVRDAAGEDRNRTVLLGRLKFLDGAGRKSKREVLVALPEAPSPGGCGYLFLEGNSSELRRYERAFLAAVADARYKKLVPANSAELK